MASIKVMSLKLSKALTKCLSSCLISVSVIFLVIHPNTTKPRGCKAGLYRKAKLFDKAVHCCNQLQFGKLAAQCSMISSKASVMSAKESKERGSLSGGDMAKLRSPAPEKRSL